LICGRVAQPTCGHVRQGSGRHAPSEKNATIVRRCISAKRNISAAYDTMMSSAARTAPGEGAISSRSAS
jgi:hypothetical protein